MLPEETLFSQPFSDPLAPDSSLTVRGSAKSQAGIIGRLGLNRAMVQYDHGHIRTQIGFMALAYMGFESDDELTFGLRTFDGIFAVPVSVRFDQTTVTLRWLHLSSHYADGVREDTELPSNTDSTSQESFELSISKTMGWVTGYQRFEWRYHSIHETSRFVGAFGLDVSPLGPAVPYASAFLYGDLNGGGLSGEFGLLARGPNTVRVGISGYAGRPIPGKLNAENENYLGLTVVFSQ
jgi:hypothetical protein